MSELDGRLRQDFDAPPLVRISGLGKRFGAKRVLDGLELTVPEGSVYALAGANGAGKTTTLRLVLGLTPRCSGRLEVAGHDPATDSAAVRAQVGHVPDSAAASWGWMRVGRFLAHHAAYRPTWDAAYAERLVAAFEVDPAARLEELSKGQGRRVQLIAALAHRPRLLLFDEPTDGLDPVMRDRFQELLADHLAAAEEPPTVVVSTHLLTEVELLADHLGVLAGGRLTTQTDTATLARKLRRYRAWVGEGFAGLGELEPAVLARRGQLDGGARPGSEVEWLLWGDEARLRRALEERGAEVRQCRPLGLAEAARWLIRAEEAR